METQKKAPDHFKYGYVGTLHYYSLTKKHALARGEDAWEAEQRRLAETDLFFLLVFICKRPDINREWLFDRCREVQLDPNGYLDLWARDHYKAVDLEEPVPTPQGWKAHGDLEVGDYVYGSDGVPTKIIAKTPVFTDADCYRVTFDDGYSVVVSGEHLWEVQKRTRKREYRRKGLDRETLVMNTADMAEHDHRPDNRIAVRVPDPIDMPNAVLPVRPYTLGLWLGDGHGSCGRITCGDDECFDRVRQDGYDLGNSPPSAPLTRTVYGLSPVLRGLGLLNNKHIPIFYHRASISQRLDLLRGLMDSDGHCNTRGTATFVNKNERLARDVFDLCSGLGLKPHFRKHKDSVFHVSFEAYKGRAPFHLERKRERCKDGDRNSKRFIISVEPVESIPVSCIQVENGDGLYQIGKHYCLTHNSTIITFGLTLQDIINDPEITIGIFSHTKAIAKEFVKQLKTEMENNPDLPRLWPEIFFQKPANASKKWSEDAIRVKRKGNPKEETVEAHGLVEGMPTGKHFRLRIYDDVVTMEGVNTPEQIAKTTEAWQMSDNLGTKGGIERYIGTRYHLFDTYSVMLDGDAVIPRLRPATDDGTEYGNPVLLSQEELDKKRRTQGPFVFGSQMLLDPVADKSMGFALEWIVKGDTDYHAAMGSLWRFILVDPASRKPHSVSKAKKNDYTSMWVIGYGLDEKYRVLDMRRDKMNLTKRTDTLIELHKKWKPGLVGYEDYGMQSDIEHIKHVQKEKVYEFEITPIGGKMKKELRILRLVPLFENGYKSVHDGGDGVPKSRIILPTSCNQIDYEGRNRDLVKDFIEQEYTAFPVLKHDDMLDCLARIIDLEKMGLIEKPSVVPAKSQSTRVEDALRNMGKQGNQSWVTA